MFTHNVELLLVRSFQIMFPEDYRMLSISIQVHAAVREIVSISGYTRSRTGRKAYAQKTPAFLCVCF
jgi:hypothetical protein